MLTNAEANQKSSKSLKDIMKKPIVHGKKCICATCRPAQTEAKVNTTSGLTKDTKTSDSTDTLKVCPHHLVTCEMFHWLISSF